MLEAFLVLAKHVVELSTYIVCYTHELLALLPSLSQVHVASP